MVTAVNKWRCKIGWHPYTYYGWAKRRCLGCGKDEAFVYNNGKSEWIDYLWSVNH